MRYGSSEYYIVPTQIIECCNMIKEYEIENNITYDYIIITRFDLTFNNMYSDYDIDYNKPTGKNEMIELLNRLHFILKDLVSKNIINNNFCIGGTELIEKNNIYEFFLKVIVGDGGFEKINTNVYPKVGWGLYFSI
jgi:hypothetical protein